MTSNRTTASAQIVEGAQADRPSRGRPPDLIEPLAQRADLVDLQVGELRSDLLEAPMRGVDLVSRRGVPLDHLGEAAPAAEQLP
jgi:hypothetical protein